jgi:hypothetical protein
MSRKPKWVGTDLHNLLTLSIKELQKIYPEEKQSTLKGKKAYWKKKLLNGEIEMPEKEPNPTANQTTVEQVGDNLVSTIEGWYEVVTKDAEGVAQVHRLYKHSTKTRPSPNQVFQPVEPAIIRPNRAKIPKRNYKGIFVFSDAQIGYRRINDELVPIHDERAISAAQKLANDLRPNYVVDCGDTTDLGELGKYPVDSNHLLGTLQPSLQRTHNLYAEFTAATPGAERHAVDSNHVKRLGDYVLRNAFALYDIRGADEKYPALSYPGLLKLEQIGWEWHGGYGAAEYEYADDLAFIHGTFAVSNGSTAAKLSKANYGRNIVQGHAHRMETQYATDRRGNQYGAFAMGALCRRDGIVPSYHSSIDHHNQPVKHFENWQNGVMYIRDYGDGKYQFDHIPIHNGVIYYAGKEYRGDE